MKFEIKHRAPDGDLFAPMAFDGQVGKTVTLRVGNAPARAVLVCAEVIDSGAAALLTFEMAGEVAALIKAGLCPGRPVNGPPLTADDITFATDDDVRVWSQWL